MQETHETSGGQNGKENAGVLSRTLTSSTIGHVDHGKDYLTAAISRYAESLDRRVRPAVPLGRGRPRYAINIAHVVQTAERHYAHVDTAQATPTS